MRQSLDDYSADLCVVSTEQNGYRKVDTRQHQRCER